MAVASVILGIGAQVQTGGQARAADQVVTLTAADSAFVMTSEPTVAHAGGSSLFVTSSAYRTFLRFDTSKLGSNVRVVSAELDVYATNINAVRAGLQVRPTTSTWNSATLTAANRPAADARVLNTLVQPALRTVTRVPLTNLHTIDVSGGQTSFELSYKEANPNLWLAKMGTNAPKLVLTVALNPVATPDLAPAGFTATDLPAQSSHEKLVFAHYFAPHPISLDNAAPSIDYWARNYLKPSGENGKWAYAGGLVRDRPIPQAPTSGNWRLTNLRTEVRQAIASGIDGFSVDVLDLNGTNWTAMTDMMTAAASENGSFKIMIMPDMTSASVAGASQVALADHIAKLAAYPAAYHLPDGRLVLSPFAADMQTPTWWIGTLDILKRSYGISTAFLPVLVNTPTTFTSFAPISYGLSEWGVRDPFAVASRVNFAAKAHALGKIWMAPIAVQDVRPRSGFFFEGDNTQLLRDSWQRAIADGADMAQLVSWNDYSESTSVAPSVDHGYSFLDINSYYMSQFQTRATQPIVRDVVYVTHRIQMFQAKPSYLAEVPMSLAGSTAGRNTVELLTLLTAPAVVTVNIGGNSYTYSAPAGVYAKTYPLSYGTISGSAGRGEQGSDTIALFTSPYKVSATPFTQDLTYYAVSSLRANPPSR